MFKEKLNETYERVTDSSCTSEKSPTPTMSICGGRCYKDGCSNDCKYEAYHDGPHYCGQHWD